MADFTVNNIINKSTGILLLYIIYRQDPYFRFKPQPKINIMGPIIKQIQLINIYNFINQIKQLTELLQSKLIYT